MNSAQQTELATATLYANEKQIAVHLIEFNYCSELQSLANNMLSANPEADQVVVMTVEQAGWIARR